MSKLGRYRKFAVAVLTAAAITGQAAYTDSSITQNEWGKIALSALGAALVYFVRNDQTVTSRRDLAARLGRPVDHVGGYESGSTPASEMPPPSTGIKPPARDPKRPPFQAP